MKNARNWSRRKSAAKRHPCGKIIATKDAILPETMERRAELVGEKNKTNPDAAIALGVLKLRGIISERQYQAGIRLEAAHKRWSSLAGISPRTPKCGDRDGISPPDPSAEAWRRAKSRYDDLRAAVMNCAAPLLAWASMETIVLDGYLPEAFLAGNVPPIARTALLSALNAIADYFDLPHADDRRAA